MTGAGIGPIRPDLVKNHWKWEQEIFTMWSRNDGGARVAKTLVAKLAAGVEECQGPLGGGESVGDFHAYLYAARPECLSMLGLGARAWAPGHSSSHGAAAVLGNGRLIHGADTGSVERVHRWADQWRPAGSPSAASLRPMLEEVRGGRFVRARVPVPAGEECHG